MSLSKFGALVIMTPDEAKRRILKALERAKGDRKDAAKALGVTHRSLFRYIEDLRLGDSIDRMMEEKGFPRRGAPPRASKRIRDAILNTKGDIAAAAQNLEMDLDALQDRIDELSLWEELNTALAAAGAPTLEVPTQPRRRSTRPPRRKTAPPPPQAEEEPSEAAAAATSGT